MNGGSAAVNRESAAVDGEAQTVREIVARGDLRFADGDADGALADYELAAETDPDDGEAIAGVGLALAELGRREEGLERLRGAGASLEHGPAYLIWVARALVVLGAAEEARTLAARVTGEHAERWRADPRLAVDLGQLWLDLGEPQRGLDVLPHAPEAPAEGEAHLHTTRGNCLAALGRREEAIAELDAAVELEPQNAQALLDSAAVLALLGRQEAARERAKRARATGALDPWGRLALADILDHAGARDEAREVLAAMARDAVWRGQRASAVGLAERLAAHEEQRRAVDLLTALLSEPASAAFEDAAPALRLRARLLVDLGDPARAADDVDALAAGGATFEDPALRSLAATTYFAAGRPAQALPHLQVVTESSSGDERVWPLLLTGMALVSLGRGEEAQAPLREVRSTAAARGVEPHAAGLAALFLALALGGEDRPEQARLVAEADRLLPPDDSNRPLLGLKALELAVLGQDWAQALRLSEGLAEQLPPPVRATALFLRGRTLVQESRNAEARGVLDAALDPGEQAPAPIRANALTWRAVALGALGEHGLAREDLLEALDLTESVTLPESAARRRELRLLVARVELRLNDADAALRILDELAADGAPVGDAPVTDTGDYWELRAEALLALDRYADASDAARRLADLDPTKRRFALFLQLGLRGLELDWSGFTALTAELVSPPPEPAGATDWLLTACVRGWFDHPGTAEALERAVALDPKVRDTSLGQQARMLVAAQRGDVTAFDDVGPPGVELGSRPRALWHVLRAKALLSRPGHEQAALAEVDEIVRLADQGADPVTDLQAVVSLARASQVRLEQGDVAGAGDALEQAERFLARLPDPGALRPIVALARSLWQMAENGPDAALAELDRADDRLPLLPQEQQAVVAYVRGSLLRVRGDDEMALAAFRRAVDLHPTDPLLLRALAAVQVDLGDDDAALATIRRAPHDGRGRELDRLESTALRRTGRLEAALESARRAVDGDWEDPQGWLTLGEAYQALDRLDQAVAAYRRGWRLARDSDGVAARCLVGVSRALLLAEKDQDALQALDSPRERSRVERIGKVYGAVPYNRAVALLRSGDDERALRALDEAARAQHPVPQASKLAAAVSARRRSRDGSWVGYWFLDPAGGRWRRLLGGALVLVFVLGVVVGMANPAEVSWLRWASTESAGRLVLLLAAAALLLLPVVTKLKVGGVEIEQPQPVPADAPDLEPMSVGDVMADVTTIVARTTAAPMGPAGAVPMSSGGAAGSVAVQGLPESRTSDLAIGATAAPPASPHSPAEPPGRTDKQAPV